MEQSLTADTLVDDRSITPEIEHGLDIGTPPVLRAAAREVLDPRDESRRSDHVPAHWQS